MFYHHQNRIIAVIPAALKQEGESSIFHSYPGASHGGIIINHKFDTSCFYCEIEEAEEYYNDLLDQNNIVKKERKLMLDKKVATY